MNIQTPLFPKETPNMVFGVSFGFIQTKGRVAANRTYINRPFTIRLKYPHFFTLPLALFQNGSKK